MISSRWSPPRVLKRPSSYSGYSRLPQTNRYHPRYRHHQRVYSPQSQQIDQKAPANLFDTRSRYPYQPSKVGNPAVTNRGQATSNRYHSSGGVVGGRQLANTQQAKQLQPLPINKHTSRSIQMVERRYPEPEIRHHRTDENHPQQEGGHQQAEEHNLDGENPEEEKRYEQRVDPTVAERIQPSPSVITEVQPSVISPQTSASSTTRQETVQSTRTNPSTYGVWVKTGFTLCSKSCGKGKTKRTDFLWCCV